MGAYIRKREEIQLPFIAEGSPVRKAGLLLASLEVKTFPCPHTKIRKETGDTKRAAKSMVDETRQWSNSSFMSGQTVFFASLPSYEAFFSLLVTK